MALPDCGTCVEIAMMHAGWSGGFVAIPSPPVVARSPQRPSERSSCLPGRVRSPGWVNGASSSAKGQYKNSYRPATSEAPKEFSSGSPKSSGSDLMSSCDGRVEEMNASRV